MRTLNAVVLAVLPSLDIMCFQEGGKSIFCIWPSGIAEAALSPACRKITCLLGKHILAHSYYVGGYAVNDLLDMLSCETLHGTRNLVFSVDESMPVLAISLSARRHMLCTAEGHGVKPRQRLRGGSYV